MSEFPSLHGGPLEITSFRARKTIVSSTFLNYAYSPFNKMSKINFFFSASPRLEVPEVYNEGLIFRFEEVIRLKIPLIAKPAPRITW